MKGASNAKLSVMYWILGVGVFLSMAAGSVAQPYVDLETGGPTRFRELEFGNGDLSAYDMGNGVVLRVVIQSLSILPGGGISGLANVEVANRSVDGQDLVWQTAVANIPVTGSYRIKITASAKAFDLATDGFDFGGLEIAKTSQFFILRGATEAARFSIQGRMGFSAQDTDTEHTSASSALRSGSDTFLVRTQIVAGDYHGSGLSSTGDQSINSASFEATNSSIQHTWGGEIDVLGDAVIFENVLLSGGGSTTEVTGGGLSSMTGRWYVANSRVPGVLRVASRNDGKNYRGSAVWVVGSTQTEAQNEAADAGQAFPDVDDLDLLPQRETFIAEGAAVYTAVFRWPSPVVLAWLDELDLARMP